MNEFNLINKMTENLAKTTIKKAIWKEIILNRIRRFP